MTNTMKIMLFIFDVLLAYDIYRSMFMKKVIFRLFLKKWEVASQDTENIDDIFERYDGLKQEYDFKVNSFKILANGSYLILVLLVIKIVFN